MFRLTLYRGVFRLANGKLAHVNEVAYVEGSCSGCDDGERSLSAAADQCGLAQATEKGTGLSKAIRPWSLNPLAAQRYRQMAEEYYRAKMMAR